LRTLRILLRTFALNRSFPITQEFISQSSHKPAAAVR
jgi:hypothetical protein